MKEDNGPSDRKLLLVGKWLLVTMLGWAISLLAIGGASVHSWSEWQALVVSYGLNGALIWHLSASAKLVFSAHGKSLR